MRVLPPRPFHAGIAQSVERRPEEPSVGGSNPSASTIYCGIKYRSLVSLISSLAWFDSRSRNHGRYISWLDSLADNEKVVRSSRTRPTNSSIPHWYIGCATGYEPVAERFDSSMRYHATVVQPGRTGGCDPLRQGFKSLPPPHSLILCIMVVPQTLDLMV